MSYKNDHLLVIANKYGKASGDAKVQLYETYDKLRDLTVSGPALGGQGYGKAASWLLNMAQMIAPSSFMPILGREQMNVPGTSYSTPMAGGNSITPGGQAAFGLGYVGTQSGFPSGGAAPVQNTSVLSAVGGAIGSIANPIVSGIGSAFSALTGNSSISGMATGGAAGLAGLSGTTDAAGLAQGATGGYTGGDFALKAAGLVSGVGGVIASMAPYFGPLGIPAGIAAQMATGYGGAVVEAYQRVRTNILNNADTILSTKVRNIETVVKQLDVQSDIVKKMLKDSMEGAKKGIQDL